MLEWGDSLPIPTEKALLAALKMEGYAHPLLPFAVKVLVESFEQGDPYLTSSLPGPVSMAVDPAGNLAALLGRISRGDFTPPGNPEPKRTRRKTKRDKAMSRGLREAQAKARKKNGDFKKGWNQARVMKEAHRLARKYGPSTRKGQVRKTARRAYER